MGLLIRLLIPALLVALLVRWVMRVTRQTGSGHKCADCVHCRGMFDDGTLCSFGPREVFKNPVQVANCVDHRRRPARP